MGVSGVAAYPAEVRPASKLHATRGESCAARKRSRQRELVNIIDGASFDR